MPGKRLKVAVLLSGGVDSSVALRLLHAAGHDCTAFYLKIWFQEDFENFWSECPWDEDLKYARAVCDQVRKDGHNPDLTLLSCKVNHGSKKFVFQIESEELLNQKSINLLAFIKEESYKLVDLHGLCPF
ncbi:hypothetical protein COCNU_05G004090 [Cocos nucifera]|uniref:tRNA 2-thiouridine(34) synthase MnmA n=1 Tax=Cocos nucifera TaxID=13894 RepID=A0A8K0I859_COCNU|nr:hypothetical protein COCNU_05G004090 [Cocos nucifera]